tara:strand:- start:164067 stop:164876 length:810 start_codon:yes stop_codon:yes gene_type:complete
MSKLLRLLSAPLRAEPDFIVIGAQKSGTTSMYAYLVQHPQIHTCSKKELHYFDTYIHRGDWFYRSFFPLKSKVKKGDRCGEASTGYLLHPLVPKRIKEFNPNTKIIALLRDPVDRAISSYHHQIRKGTETHSMEEAFKIEEERLKDHWKKILTRSGEDVKKSSKAVRQFSYKKRGMYLEQLRPYFETFKKENIYIEYSENFFQDPARVLKEIFDFLGVDANFTPSDLAPKNVKAYADADESIINWLKDYYRLPNKELEEFLGKKSPWEY